MVSDSFWSVEVGRGMGPLAFGMSREGVIQCLKQESIAVDFDARDHDAQMYIGEIDATLVFATRLPGTLVRIDVDDDRINFAKWDVISKPIHKVVRLFKCADKDTLWCNNYDEKSQSQREAGLPDSAAAQTLSDSDLLCRGTLWIPALGLGFSLEDGLVATVHVCAPEHVPKYGTGTWNNAQRVMSETGRVTAVKLQQPKRRNSANLMLNIILAIALGIVAWQAISLQLRWNAQPDIAAVVVAIDPPPPHPFGDFFTVQYADADGKQHRIVMERMQFYAQPELDEKVNIRVLPEAPDKPVGPSRIGDEGLNLAFPRVFFVVVTYFVISLVMQAWSWIAFRR